MTDTTKQAEPVARLEEISVGTMHDEKKQKIVDAINAAAHPALALTAELKAELLEALNFGQDAADNDLTAAYNVAEESPGRYEVIDCRTTALKKIKAAITKLTNLECGS